MISNLTNNHYIKPVARGRSVFLREVNTEDAEFILTLRTSPVKGKHLSFTSNSLEDQKNYILNYRRSLTDYYFIICDWKGGKLGTIRIYDIKNHSFCWGSWIISSNAPSNTGIESVLLLYDFAFFSLHYTSSHFDVRKNNSRVIKFHERFGATIRDEDEENYYFVYDLSTYLLTRPKYTKFLPVSP